MILSSAAHDRYVQNHVSFELRHFIVYINESVDNYIKRFDIINTLPARSRE